LNISCTKDYEMHFFNFLLSSSFHMRLHSKALFSKPMFRVNKLLLISKNNLMTWQNIPSHVIKYFAKSLEICHVENKYTKNILWHVMECFWRFYPTQVSKFTCSPNSIIGQVMNKIMAMNQIDNLTLGHYNLKK